MFAARNKSILVRCYLIFVISFLALMAFLTVNFFFRLQEQSWAPIVSKVFYSLFMIDLNFMVFFIPFLSVWMVGLRWKAGANATFISLTSAYFVLIILFIFVFPNNVVLYIFLVGIFTGMLIFSIAIIMTHRDRIPQGQLKNLCIGFVLLSAVFCPIIITDACVAYLRDSQNIHSIYGV
jgi:hypothetical protein